MTTATSHVRRRRTGSFLVLVVLLVGLTASWAGATVVDRIESRHVSQQMDRYADDTGRDVAGEAARYLETVTDLAASISAQSDLTADDFTAITVSVSRRLPGAAGALFVVPTTDAQAAATQSFWRTKGLPDLKLVKVGTRREHLFTIHARSFDGVPPVHGRDLSQQPEAVAVMKLARESGQVAASSTYVLLKDRALPTDRQQQSFLLAAPVLEGAGSLDQGRFRGWVVMSVRAGDFINQTLRDHSRDLVEVTLSDVSVPNAPVVVANSGDGPGKAGRLQRSRTLQVGQRIWLLRVHPIGSLLPPTDARLAELVLGTGVLMTLLLSTLVGVLATARDRALVRVDDATGALRIDIEQRKATEARLRERDNQLRHLAFHDSLTGLANRTLFYDRTEHAITRQDRTNEVLAVLYVDLDGFKQVNDDRGHAAGDLVLTEVGVRLNRCARKGDTIARVGGDEFAVLLERMADSGDAELVAERIVAALGVPYAIGGEPATVTGSVGIAIRRPGHGSVDELLHAADRAMYAAKFSGADRYVMAG